MFLSLLLLNALPWVQEAATPDPKSLLPVSLSGRWGFVDGNGETKIHFLYQSASFFAEGRAVVDFNGLMGFITPTGTLATDRFFDQARSYHQGWAAAALETDRLRWGFIDASGEWLGGPPKWDEVGDFSEGLAAVRRGRTAGYLGTDGELKIEIGMGVGLPSSFLGGKAAYNKMVIGSGSLNPEVGVAIDTDGEVLFERPGRLTRIPGGFLLQRAAGDNAFQVLNEDGNPRHPAWFRSLAIPLEPGPITVQGENGYAILHADGNLVDLDRVREAFAFSEGLAAAHSGETGRFGYLDTQGNWVIHPIYTFAGDFHDGRALVKLGPDLLWIDRSGSVLWDPRLQEVQAWETALAEELVGESIATFESLNEPQALVLDDLVGIYRNRTLAMFHARVDSGDHVVLPTQPESGTVMVYRVRIPLFIKDLLAVERPFTLIEEDLLAAWNRATGDSIEDALKSSNNLSIRNDMRLFRILERDLPQMTGKLAVDGKAYFQVRGPGPLQALPQSLIGPHDDYQERPEDQLPQPDPRAEGGFTYWSPVTFDQAFAGVFDDARQFSEGLAAASRAGLYGFINLQGSWVIEPRFTNTGAFHQNLCLVQFADSGDFGYIDRSGATVFMAGFDAHGDFHDGRAIIGSGVKWGYMNEQGEAVIAPFYDWVGDFASGLAPVRLEDKVGFVDTAGAVVVPLKYKMGSSHVEGMATVVDFDDQMHYLDATGAVVFSGKFSFASDFFDGAALVQINGGGWQLVDTAGDFLAVVKEVE